MDWFKVRSNFIGRLTTWFTELIQSNNLDSNSFASATLNAVKKFLLQEKYVLSLEEKEYFSENIKLYYFGLATNLNKESTSGIFSQFLTFAHASDVDRDRAFSRAVGEFIERYSFLIYSERNLLRASIKKLEAAQITFLNPFKMPILSPERTNEDTDFMWVKGEKLPAGTETLLPAQLVFWNYDVTHSNWSEPLLRERNTCGLASGPSEEIAIRNALYEVIQRDAFFIYWFNELSPVRIEIDRARISECFERLLTLCDSRSIEYTFLDVTADIPVPTFLCLLRGKENGQPILSFGFGSGFDADANLESALLEALGLYRWTADAHEEGMSSLSFAELSTHPNWRQNFTANDRALLWSRKDMWEHIAFLTAGETKEISLIKQSLPKFSDLKEEFQFVLTNLTEKGEEFEPIVFFSPHSLVKSLSSNAVRVFVPGLVPMYMEEIGSVTEDHPRLKNVPKKMELKSRTTIYPYPHPFP